MKKSFVVKITGFILALAIFTGIGFAFGDFGLSKTVYAETTPNYLTLTAKGGSVDIIFKCEASVSESVSYRIGTSDWITYNKSTDQSSAWYGFFNKINGTGIQISLTENESVQFKGTNLMAYSEIFGDYVGFFSMSAKTEGATVEASGDITSLTNGTGGDVNLGSIENYTGCYQHMFSDCSILTKAPNLPSTILTDVCYFYMFSGCTGLTTAPSLPATTLAECCYQYMFYGCTKLATASDLPAETLFDYCYSSMFEGCTSLAAVPKMAAKVLKTNSCTTMFKDCTKLEAPADMSNVTSLSTSSCYQMYQGCIGIKMYTTAQTGYAKPWTTPNIADASLWNYGMFGECGANNCCNSSDPALNTTYYIKDEAYTIEYNTNGGSGTAPTGVSEKRIGDSITLEGYSGTKTGYQFAGWSTDSSATSGTTAGASYTLREADKPASGTTITFYAVWEVVPHEHGTKGSADYIKFDKVLNASFTGGALASGNYYLAEDVTLTSAITIANGETVALCLNGHVLSGNGTTSVIINSGVATITDLNTTAEHYFIYATDSNWVATDTNTGAITVDEITSSTESGAIIKVLGGCITGGNSQDWGGGIHNKLYTLNICGGNIVGNTGYHGGGGGGEDSSGTIILSGGAIIGNRATLWGGGVYGNTYSTITIAGGTISYNSAETSGGGVYGNTYSTITIAGGIISDNYAETSGGGVYGNTHSTVTVTGGIISDNSAEICGGGIICGSVLKMSGGTVTNNTAALAGGAFAVAPIIGGTANITGNTLSDGTTVSNLFLPSNVSITLATCTDMAVGVTTATVPTATTPVAITVATDTDYSAYFTSDSDEYILKNVGSGNN